MYIGIYITAILIMCVGVMIRKQDDSKVIRRNFECVENKYSRFMYTLTDNIVMYALISLILSLAIYAAICFSALFILLILISPPILIGMYLVAIKR